jgi:hypothetical protein
MGRLLRLGFTPNALFFMVLLQESAILSSGRVPSIKSAMRSPICAPMYGEQETNASSVVEAMSSGCDDILAAFMESGGNVNLRCAVRKLPTCPCLFISSEITNE